MPLAPLVNDNKALHGAAEWRNTSGVDVTGGVVAGDVSPPMTIASSGRHDSSVVPELVAAYDQGELHPASCTLCMHLSMTLLSCI